MPSDERVARQDGAALGRGRERRKRRQYVVAQLAGVTKSVLSQFEHGRRCSSVPTLAKMLVLVVLDCSAEEFGRHRGPWRCLGT
jgi:predicted transcriptional regulator